MQVFPSSPQKLLRNVLEELEPLTQLFTGKRTCDLCSRQFARGRGNVRKYLLMEGHLRPCLTAPAILQWKGEAKICNYDQKGKATALAKLSSATWIFSGETEGTRTAGCTGIA